MPLYGRRQLVGGNADTVVTNLNEIDSALIDRNVNPRGTRVEGVLDQLFDHGSRTLDNLTRCDLFDGISVKVFDRHWRIALVAR